MNRKERRAELHAPNSIRCHAKFLYKEKADLKMETIETDDGRTTAKIYLEGYLSTVVKDGSGDIVDPNGIDLSRFEAGNAPLKAMHGRGILSNVGVIYSAIKDSMGLYIKAYTMLDITKDNNGRPLNDHDYTLYTRVMDRVVNGFSIGFLVEEKHYDKEKDALVYDRIVAYEGSIVDVPDNPLTLIKALKGFGEMETPSEKDGKEDIKEEENSILSKQITMIPQVGDVVVFTEMDYNEEWMIEEEKHVGKVLNVVFEGTVMDDDDTMNGSQENPIVMVHVHKAINGDLIPTTEIFTKYLNQIQGLELYNPTMDSELKTLATEEEKEEPKEKPKEGETVAEETSENTSETGEGKQEEVADTTTTKETETKEETTQEATQVEVQSENDGQAVKTEQEKGLKTENRVSEKSFSYEETKSLFDKQEAMIKDLGNQLKESQEVLEIAIETIDLLQKAQNTRYENVEIAINSIVKTMKSIVVDAPLQYVHEPKQKETRKSQLHKVIDSLKRSS